MTTQYPEQPGFKTINPETSKLAATRMLHRADIIREQVIELLESRTDCTADECACTIGESILSVRPRFSELHAQGKIEPTKNRRRNESGHSAVAWRLVRKRELL